MIKVSIIVPVYNVEFYLDKCLHSLVNQTLKEIEIIIVNDGSKDNSYKIIQEYIEIYPDKIICIEKENGGLSDARNNGLLYAKGEYIGCVDGDDYVDTKMFKEMYLKAKSEDADMVVCDYYHVYGNKLKLRNAKLSNSDDPMISLKSSAWNKIIRREIAINISYPVGLQYEDVEYFYKIIPHIQKVGFIEIPLYYYVQRNNSIMSTHNRKTLDIFNVWENILKYYKKECLYEKYKNELEYIFARSLLCGAFLRILKINDKELMKAALQLNWQTVTKTFPNWRNNHILKNSFTRMDIFIKSQNKFTYTVYSNLFNFFISKVIPFIYYKFRNRLFCIYNKNITI